MQKPLLMQQTMRWFGPNDPVSLASIRQAGCSGVVTALHQIPVGEPWPVAAIEERRRQIELAGMDWTVVESLPVSDDIKRRTGLFEQHIEHYNISLRHLATQGIRVVTYNFMPVFDWLRTDVSFELPTGGKALRFDRLAFVAFDLFLLKRPQATRSYHPSEQEAARAYFEQMTHAEQEQLFENCMLGLPGSTVAFTPEQVFEELDKYAEISADQLRKHLVLFLEAILPTAQEVGIQLAIHPDDPPFSILGLPRIVSTEEDLMYLFEAVPATENGLCFCTGSLGARADNNIMQMIDRFGDRIHFLHLRNTQRDAQGNFYEAGHLEGDTNMYEVIHALHKLQQRRRIQLPMRPDHGHQLLGDLQQKFYPGYSLIGRLKSLAELRGVEYAIAQSIYSSPV